MGHFLHFGAGPNQLPEPWQNLNAEHDIRKRLKFADESASLILAEHVIEHVPWLQGFGFLQECRRVLEPGGVLRLAFPDVARFLSTLGGESGPTADSAPDRISLRGWKWNTQAGEYARAMARDESRGNLIRNAPEGEKLRAGVTLLLVGWMHQAAWTEATAAGVLLAVGFEKVLRLPYGKSWLRSELAGVDGHHKDVGDEIAFMETTILEAQK